MIISNHLCKLCQILHTSTSINIYQSSINSSALCLGLDLEYQLKSIKGGVDYRPLLFNLIKYAQTDCPSGGLLVGWGQRTFREEKKSTERSQLKQRGGWSIHRMPRPGQKMNNPFLLQQWCRWFFAKNPSECSKTCGKFRKSKKKGGSILPYLLVKSLT